MNLVAALNIYRNSGPGNPTHDDRTSASNACRVVHSHLKQGEIQELALAWKFSSTSKAMFLAKLTEVVARLESEGKLDV